MNIALFLIGLLPYVLLIYLYKKNKNLKDTMNKLQDDFARFREGKEAFSIELEKSNAELANKSTDPLTGLPARTALEDRIRQAIALSQRFQACFAVLSMDMDDFSQIDQGQPEIRDDLLVQISQRALSVIRQLDSVTRFAGSHFVFLLPQITQPETAAYAASRLQECMLKPFDVNGHEYHMTASIGIAIYPLDGDSMEILLQKSSSALHEAKRMGKNKYYFWHREIHALSERENQIFLMLRATDFLTHLAVRYFPQVIAASGRVTGIYAAASLLHPTLGEIASNDFMKMAEHCGRATEVIAWVFRQAVEEAKRHYQKDQGPIVLALSVTSRQIENAHFVFQMTQLAKEIDQSIVQPVFEIIDSPSRAQSSLIQKGFQSLSESGIHFAIQMIAIGYNLLQKFPSTTFNYFKIDIKLVNSTVLQPEGEAILSSMMTLTKNVGMDVIVEGVDQEGQKQYLMSLGFQKLQGQLFEYLLLDKASL